MAETFYDVLGVPADAEVSEITAAYRERIKETHPDVSDAADAEERSKQVIEAKEVLTDEDERARYDRLGHDAYIRETSTNANWPGDADGASAAGSNASSDRNSWASAAAASRDWTETDDAETTWSGRGDWRQRRRSASRADRNRSSAHGTASSASSSDVGPGWTGDRTDETSTDGDETSVGSSNGDSSSSGGTGAGAGTDAGAGAGAEAGARTGTEAGSKAASSGGPTPNGGTATGRHVSGEPGTADGTARASVGAAATTGNVGGAVDWAASERHAVRQNQGRSGVHRSRLFPPTQSRVLLVSTFVIYPAMVFSTFFPPFPLVFNLIVGLCTVIVIAYLSSMPEVGVYVFGGWTVLATLTVLISAINPLSLVGILILGSTWFPLGLTLATYHVLRW